MSRPTSLPCPRRGVPVALALVLAPLAACTGGERNVTGDCPAGETCSPLTPRGLLFGGAAFADVPASPLLAPPATAIGGTQAIALSYDPGPGGAVPFDLPYEADDDGATAIRVEGTDGPVVTVAGVGGRANYLRIVDPRTGELYDRKLLAAATVTTLRLIGTELEELPSPVTDLVWGPGRQTIGVALAGDVADDGLADPQRLVDTSMTLALAGASRVTWDSVRLAGATPGTYALAVSAGSRPPQDLMVEIVAGADAIALIGSGPTVPPGGSTTVCFTARSGARHVYGLVWQYDVAGAMTTKGADALARNCIAVSGAGAVPGARIPVTATAGGRALATEVVVTAPTARPAPTGEHPGSAATARADLARTPAGERAAAALARAGW